MFSSKCAVIKEKMIYHIVCLPFFPGAGGGAFFLAPGAGGGAFFLVAGGAAGGPTNIYIYIISKQIKRFFQKKVRR